MLFIITNITDNTTIRITINYKRLGISKHADN